MFERIFQWTVRNGSRVLFAIAVLIIAASIALNIWNTLHESYVGVDMVLVIASGVVAALKNGMLPLVAAVVIEFFNARAASGHTPT